MGICVVPNGIYVVQLGICVVPFGIYVVQFGIYVVQIGDIRRFSVYVALPKGLGLRTESGPKLGPAFELVNYFADT